MMALRVQPWNSIVYPDVQAYINIRTSVSETPKSIQQEATRMANLVIDRVRSGGEERVVKNRCEPRLTSLTFILCSPGNGRLISTGYAPYAAAFSSGNDEQDVAAVGGPDRQH